jgi:hypothetical protein
MSGLRDTDLAITSRQAHNFLISLHTLRARGNVLVRRYATSRKVTGSRPDEVNDFFLFT